MIQINIDFTFNNFPVHRTDLRLVNAYMHSNEIDSCYEGKVNPPQFLFPCLIIHFYTISFVQMLPLIQVIF
jgi:hypothetical protein